MPSPTPAPTPLTLDYASPVSPPLRFGYRSLGAGLIAFAGIVHATSVIAINLLQTPDRIRWTLRTITIILQCAAAVPAVPLLAAALPHAAPSVARRWKSAICLAMAALLLSSAATAAIAHFYQLTHFTDSLVIDPPNLPLQVLNIFTILLEGLLLLAAALYLLALGTRLARPALGIALAGAMAPSSLIVLTQSFAEFLEAFDRTPYHFRRTISFANRMSPWYSRAHLWAIILFFAIALFAAILARYRPRSHIPLIHPSTPQH